MEDVLTFPPFQVDRKESCYREVPVDALERLYLTEFGRNENESVLSCGSAVYGISSNQEVNSLRRFSDIDYIAISGKKGHKPHYQVKKRPRWDIDVLRMEYDSCLRGLHDGTLLVMLTLARFAVPLFDSEKSYLELTSRALARILEISRLADGVLITPSYAMMQINDTRMRFKPHRWWSVYGEFALSPNARRNIEVYYDRVASALEWLCEQGSLVKVDADCPEPVYDTSRLSRERRKTPWVVDVAALHCEQVLAFLIRGRGNIPSVKKMIHVGYDACNVFGGVVQGKSRCVALFGTAPQTVRVCVA
jgi:hypothetical protein